MAGDHPFNVTGSSVLPEGHKLLCPANNGYCDLFLSQSGLYAFGLARVFTNVCVCVCAKADFCL